MQEAIQLPVTPLMRRVLNTPCPIGHGGVGVVCYSYRIVGEVPMCILFVCLERLRATEPAVLEVEAKDVTP